jgi:hypothetical protein
MDATVKFFDPGTSMLSVPGFRTVGSPPADGTLLFCRWTARLTGTAGCEAIGAGERRRRGFMPDSIDIRSQLRRRLLFAPLLLVGAIAVSGTAAATSIHMDEFAVTRNGSLLFDDTFNQNITLNGGIGSIVPSGVSYSDGSTRISSCAARSR